MANMPWFPFFWKDWLASSAHAAMLPEQRGAYIDLLARAWDNDDEAPSLPADDASLASLSGLGKRWKKLGALVRAQFEERNGRLYNAKLTDVWNEQRARYEKAVERGKTGAKARVDRLKNEQRTSRDQADSVSTQSQEQGEHTEVDTEEAVRPEPLTGSVLPASAPVALAPEGARAPADGTTLPWRASGPAVEAETARLEAEYFRVLNGRADEWLATNPDAADVIEVTARRDLGLPTGRDLSDFHRRALREHLLVLLREANDWPSSEVWIAEQRVKILEPDWVAA